MTRLSQIMAAVLVSALVAFLFAGCGGGDQTAAPATSATTGTSAGTSRAAGSAGAGTSTSAEPESLIGQQVTPTDQSPQEFQQSLRQHRPTVVFFYMTGPSDDTKERASMTSLENRYRGQVDFYDYQYTDGASYQDLTSLLRVNATPSLIIINKQGKVQRAWTGYVDDKSIEQGINEAIKS